MSAVVEQASSQQADRQAIDARLSEKNRYAAHIGAFLGNSLRGEKLSHKCLLNKRSRACLALYTALDIACRVMREEQAAQHNSAQRGTIEQAADQVEADLMLVRDYLRPLFLDRRSFDTQFIISGDLDDENAGASYGRLGGAELHRVISEAIFRTERCLQIYAGC